MSLISYAIMTPYSTVIEHQMQMYFAQLSERDKRHYAALECQKLGYGSKCYLSTLLGISRTRINRGIADLTTPSLYDEIPPAKQRRPGGGRKKKNSLIQR